MQIRLSLPLLLLSMATFAPAVSKIYINHEGYDAALPKTAVLKTTGLINVGSPFSLYSGETEVYTGKFTGGVTPSNWESDGSTYFVADFSDFKTPGVYTLRYTDLGSEQTSETIKIDDDLMGKTFSCIRCMAIPALRFLHSSWMTPLSLSISPSSSRM